MTSTMRSSPCRRSSTRRRGALCAARASKRAPSSGRHTHSVSPVPAFAATTVRRCPGREVEDAVHHQRRGLGRHRLGRRAEVVELPGPGDLEVLDVVLVDLIEGGIAGAAFVGGVRAPLPDCAAVLAAADVRPQPRWRAEAPETRIDAVASSMSPPCSVRECCAGSGSMSNPTMQGVGCRRRARYVSGCQGFRRNRLSR